MVVISERSALGAVGVSELTDKQQTLCEEYIVDLDIKQAAKRANISYGYARQLLTKSNILSEIKKLKAERSRRTEITADAVVLELAKLAFSNIKRYLDIEGDEVYFKDLTNVTDEEAAAIESVKVMKKTIKGKGEKDDDVEIQTIQYKLHSKLDALEQLGKHLGIFQKDNEQKALNIIDIMALVGINVSSK